MIKKLFLLLTLTNGFIPTQIMGAVTHRRTPKRALHTSHLENIKSDASQNQENNPTTSKPTTHNNQLKKYIIALFIVAGVGLLATYSYTANKTSEDSTSESGNPPNNNSDAPPINNNDALPINNNDNVLPDLKIPSHIKPEDIEVKLTEAFADNDPKKSQGVNPDFQDNSVLSVNHLQKIWEHHLAVKAAIANKTADYEELRNKHFYKPAYKDSINKITDTEQAQLEATLKECEGKPLFYHCVDEFNTFLIILRSQFIMPAWSGSRPGAFVSTIPELGYGGFVFALREEAAWDSPAMTTSFRSNRCWAGLSAPISLLRYLEGIYIDGSYIENYSHDLFEEIKKKVYEIKFGLLKSLYEKFNASTNETEKKQIIELFINIQKLEIQKYEELKQLPKDQHFAPKTWLRKTRYLHIISDSDGIPRLVDKPKQDDIYDAKGNKLKKNNIDLLVPA